MHKHNSIQNKMRMWQYHCCLANGISMYHCDLSLMQANPPGIDQVIIFKLRQNSTMAQMPLYKQDKGS